MSEGQQIQITAKSGKSWTATVERVIWSGNGVSIVATKSYPDDRSAGRRDERRQRATELEYQHRYGWDGVRGSPSYYSSGMYDEES